MRKTLRGAVQIAALVLLMGATGKSCCPRSGYDDGAQRDDPQPLRDDLRAWFNAGNVIFTLCLETNLGNCTYLGGANVKQGTTRMDVNQIPSQIGDNRLRSFMMVCGVPTLVALYQNPFFGGSMEAYHCVPGTALDVRNLGYMDLQTSAIVIARDDYATQPTPGAGFQDPVVQHTGIDLGQPAAVNGFHEKLAPGFIEDPDIDNASTWASQIFWTDKLSAYVSALGPSVALLPTADLWRNTQLVGFVGGVEIDPAWWLFNYNIVLEWYLEPTIADTAKRLKFEPRYWSVWVESGVLHDKIYNGVTAIMNAKAVDLADQLSTTIAETIRTESGDSSGLTEAFLLENIGQITMTIAQPKPCNPHAATAEMVLETMFVPCRHYRSVPPVIVLHKETAQ